MERYSEGVLLAAPELKLRRIPARVDQVEANPLGKSHDAPLRVQEEVAGCVVLDPVRLVTSPRVRRRDGDPDQNRAAGIEESARFAHYLVERGIKPGDRVAVMLEPSREFYVAMFGAMKMGAIAVPLFTLFGPDGIRLRVQDCAPRIVLTNAAKAPMVARTQGLEVVVADEGFMHTLAAFPTRFDAQTRGDDLAIFQYTSGTTREMPDAVKHSHRSIVPLVKS